MFDNTDQIDPSKDASRSTMSTAAAWLGWILLLALAIVDDLIGRDPESRRDRMNTLAMQIIAHMDAEERSIYRAFADADDIMRPLALRHTEEHRVARYLMTELRDEGLDDEHWAARLQVFHATIDRHVQAEESDMFDIALDYFDQSEVDAMTAKFENVEKDLFKERMIVPSTIPR